MSRTILLADDSLTIQKVVELTFADTEYQVVALSSGDELLDRMRDLRPDVVICDVIMPGKDGYAVCQEIKSDPSALHVPVILLSGTFEPFDRDKALAAGCSEIITKPFEARKLVDTVDRLLEQGPIVEPTSEASAIGADSIPDDVFEDSPIGGGEPLEAMDFGTRLSAPQPEPDGAPTGETTETGVEALDFTKTGFDEMNAAGDAASRPPEAIPEEGLDFELTESGQAEAFTPPEPSSPDSTFEEPEPAGGGEPFFDPSEGSDEADPLGRSDDGPFDSEAPSLEPSIGFGTAESEAAVEPFTQSAPEAEDFAFADAGSSEAEIQAEPDERSDDDWASDGDADSHDVEAGSEAPQSETPAGPDQETGPGADVGIAAVADSPANHRLSDEDVDRIARRVIELATERIEHIAWEVVPDMAETVVRERIRQLEADVDGGE